MALLLEVPKAAEAAEAVVTTSSALKWDFFGPEGGDEAKAQTASVNDLVHDRADGGGRAVILGSETQDKNGSLLMLQIKYLAGPRTGETTVRSSKYIEVDVVQPAPSARKRPMERGGGGRGGAGGRGGGRKRRGV